MAFTALIRPMTCPNNMRVSSFTVQNVQAKKCQSWSEGAGCHYFTVYENFLKDITVENSFGIRTPKGMKLRKIPLFIIGSDFTVHPQSIWNMKCYNGDQLEMVFIVFWNKKGSWLKFSNKMKYRFQSSQQASRSRELDMLLTHPHPVHTETTHMPTNRRT